MDNVKTHHDQGFIAKKGMLYINPTGDLYEFTGEEWVIMDPAKPDPINKVWKIVGENDKMKRTVDKVETQHKSVNNKKLVGTIDKDIQQSVNSYIHDYGVNSTVNDIPGFIEDYLTENYNDSYGLTQIDVVVAQEPHVYEEYTNDGVKTVVKEKVVVNVNFKQKHCINTTKLKYNFILKADYSEYSLC